MLHVSRRHLLRGATAPAHAAVEAAVGPIETMQDYVRYVRGITAFRTPFEVSLRSVEWPAVFGCWRPTEVSAALTSDLIDLQAEPLPELPLDIAFDMASLLGTVYVLEGSSLGAQVLYRKARQLGLSSGNGARHLALQVASPRNWRDLVNFLDHAPSIDFANVVDAANRAFNTARIAMLRAADAGR